MMLFLCINISKAQNFLKRLSSVGPITKLNNNLFFTATDGVHGPELWKSDGTVEGTVMVKDIAPGTDGSNVTSITVFKGMVYFAANDGVNGTELWKSDGTAAGTVMVKDINPVRTRNNGSDPGNLTVANGILFFTATDSDSVPTSALFKTDGTAAGTLRLTELDYFGSGQLTAVKNMIYFTRDGNRSLWKTDGTIAGTKTVIVDDYYTVDALHVINDKLVFITNTSYRTNIRLYQLNPADDKPVLLHEFNGSDIDNITQVGNGFFFSVKTQGSGSDGVDYLWHSDGTTKGTATIKNFPWQWFMSGSNMQSFASFNNKLYFAATSNFALWSSDGTTAGTVKAADSPVNTSVRPVVSNGQLFYNSGNTLWAVNASGNAKQQFSSPQSPAQLFDFNNTLYFSINSPNYNSVANDLWNNVTQPAITVTSNYSNVASGDLINYDSKIDSAVIKNITIKNNGTKELVLSEISVAGLPFYVNGNPSQVVQPGQQVSFNVEYLPGKEIIEKGTLTIRSNDSFQGNFILNLTGSAVGKANIKNQTPGGGLNKFIDFNNTSATFNLSANTVDENKDKGSVVGNFSIKNNLNAFTYQLVSGTGDADNNSFIIENGVLKTNQKFNFSIKNTYSILVKAGHDTTAYQRVFAIQINQVSAPATGDNCNATVQSLSYNLNNVDFAGQRIVAIGEGGKIIKSDNQGQDWTTVNSGTNAQFSDIQFTDDKTGYIAGTGSSTLLKTEDGGNNWFPVDVLNTQVKRMFFTSANVGYLFNNQSFLKTTDGARTWKKGLLNNYNDVNSVYFTDEKNGFLCGSSRTFMRTKNGGDTWENVTLPLGENTNLAKVTFVNSKTGYVLSANGDVLQTSDGGDNWKRVSTISSDYITGCYFVDEKTGYVVAGFNGSVIYKTVDGGLNWTNDFDGGGATLMALKFNKSKTLGCAVGYGEGLGWTGESGRTVLLKQGNTAWQKSSQLPSSDDLYSVNFTDNNTGYLFGKYKNVKTTDGGISWKPMELQGTYGLRHSFFVKDVGYAADLLDLYKTTDAGTSWTKILTGASPDQIRDVYFLDANTGFYTTFTESSMIAKTTDGGAHWVNTKLGDYKFVFSMEFANASTGFAVGSEGLILKTTNQGNTWTRLTPSTTNWLTSVHTFNVNTVLVAGYDGLLLRTTDGGNTWNEIRSSIRGDIGAIKFIDNNHGYAFTGNYGAYSQIYETLDGGATWRYLQNMDEEGNGINSFGNTVYIAGNRGLVRKIATPDGPVQPGYISGDKAAEPNVKNNYSVPGNSTINYKWTVNGDAKMSYTGNQATVQWNNPGKYTLQVSAYNNCGQGGTRSIDVTVDSVPQPKVIGPDSVLAHTVNVAYTTALHSNSTYNWVISGDSTYTATANTANVSWGNGGIGKVEVIETQTSTGIKKSALLNVDVKKVPFILPQTNFKVKVNAESCKGSNNGQLAITAALKLKYTLSMLIGGKVTYYPFTDSVSVSSLAAGNYSACITVAGQPDYQQCYNVAITEPKDLSVYASVNKTSKTVSLELGGGSNYNISLNGKVYKTQANHITLELANGPNTLQVATDKECQGIINKDIMMPDDVVAYPNPFVDNVTLLLNTKNAKDAQVEVHDINGKLMYSGKPPIEDNQMNFKLGTLNTGMYILKLTLDTKQSVIKIWKK